MTSPDCTFVPLREYVEDRIDALDARIATRLDAADKAVDAASDRLDIRLNHSNDLAAKTVSWMQETRADMVLRAEHTALSERVRKLEELQSADAGRRKGYEPLVAVVMILIAAGVAALVTTLFSSSP